MADPPHGLAHDIDMHWVNLEITDLLRADRGHVLVCVNPLRHQMGAEISPAHTHRAGIQGKLQRRAREIALSDGDIDRVANDPALTIGECLALPRGVGHQARNLR